MGKNNKPVIREIIDPIKTRSSIAIVMPILNHYEESVKNIKLIKQQTSVPDIIIVDNNSSIEIKKKLLEEFKDVIFLLADSNYWSAWWRYLWQKYAYEKWYERIIINDIDAYPVDNDLIERLIKNAWKNQVVDIVNIAERDFPVKQIFHYWIINRYIIDKIWFVDYRFFLYWDDVDYDIRLGKWWIHRIGIDAKYFHPMKNFFPSKFNYFFTRNRLYTRLKHCNLISFISFISFLLSFSLSNLILRYLWGYKYYFNFFILWLKDLLLNDFSNNEKIINSALNDKIVFKKEKINLFFEKYNSDKRALFSIKDIIEWENIVKKYWVKKNHNERFFIKIKNKIWKKILISWGFSNSSTIIQSIFFKEVVFIKDIKIKENLIEYFELKNYFHRKITTIFIFILCIPLIIIYTLILKMLYIFRNKSKS